MEYGFLSLIPPLVAIILAIWTRQVYVSLLLGVWMGWLVIAGWNIPASFMMTVEAFVDVFASASNTRTIMFSALIGALIYFMQASGGVQGFIHYVEGYLDSKKDSSEEKKRGMVQYMGWLTGVIIFVESNISVLTVGTLFRPIYDKLKISREKLAYIADSSSAPTSILIPFNAWGAFIMSLLIAQGFDKPFHLLLQTIAFNFYPIITLLMVLIVIYFRWDIGPMKKAEARVRNTGEVLSDGATPMMSNELTDTEPANDVVPLASNMLLPLLVMILMMPVMLTITGWETATAEIPEASIIDRILLAIGEGSGSTSVLVAVIVALLSAYLLYAIRKVFTGKELIDGTMTGIKGMMPLALLMMFAFAINSVCGELNTGTYVASVTEGWLSPALVPVLVFLISAFIAFSTGTSWGTFAIMIGIAVPMAQTMDANILLAVSAVLGGGVFGDHCSPISDTTIISSMASATDHIDHVRTQFPYALISGLIAAVIYLICGFLMH